MLLHCYAVVPKVEERHKLIALLKRSNVDYAEQGTHIEVNLHRVTIEMAEMLISYFQSVESDHTGYTAFAEKD